MDFNGFKDLQEQFSNSLAIINQVSEYERKNRHLELTINNMTQKIAISNESEKKLLQQLQTFSNASDEGISVLYVKLKEQYAELQNKYNQLEQTNHKLQEKFTLVKNEIIEDYNERIRVLQNKILEQNNKLLQKQNVHCNELEAQQASADLRFDDMQSRLQLQLCDATKRLRETNQSCNTLREELLIFKSRSNTNMEIANKRIQELERDLRLNRQQLQITQEKLYNLTRSQNLENYSRPDMELNYHQRLNTDSSARCHNDGTNKINKTVINRNENHRSPPPRSSGYSSSKYTPLNKEASSSSVDVPEMMPDNATIEEQKCQHNAQNQRYGGGILKKDEHRSIKTYVPPLRPLSNIKPNSKSSSKKRKLYNLEDLDYLDNFEEQE